ncbi:GIY-YIG nuclease family protein [Collimonas sp. OK412]|jgi:hypothetical protein|uniref:GIY-YIG nuclease family protein n=1 Tax=Collimonas sp. (strain OK412) TaxID=1801619 RepID=UPI0008E3FD9C|nr:GIY-YIG nuclease family protein [Collimonas sp. OK412]SFC74544.1 GIY-YIG catalytic domain-containing protein [Collimonas sp. OK412]
MDKKSAEMKTLSPLARLIIDRAIDNTNRKLIAGFRNKRNSQAGQKKTDLKNTVEDTLGATSAKSVQDVANRGVAWREMIQKSLSHGITSLNTLKFDGEFSIKNGIPEDLQHVPNTPGVYVVYDQHNTPVYVGDSGKLRQRWHAGHLNEFKQGETSGKPYKLAEQFSEGCTVKFINMESATTAAALEAHLIREHVPKINQKEELLNEQGTRSNIEAKKMKDSAQRTATLVGGAALEGLKNSAAVLLEELSAVMIKALKDEIVDVFLGGTAKLAVRLERFMKKIWAVLERLISNSFQAFKGLFEFVVNAISKTFQQICMLARNIFDLANSAWNLYQGAQTLSTEELVKKISETVIISGTMILFDALDPVIEAQLVPLVGPVAPYLSAVLSAIGFGLSSHYLQRFVPQAIEFLIKVKRGFQESIEAQRQAFEALVSVHETEFQMLASLETYIVSHNDFKNDTIEKTKKLSEHRPKTKLDINALLNK